MFSPPNSPSAGRRARRTRSPRVSTPATAARRGLTNITFEVQDTAAIPDQDRFDLITAFDAVHDQVDPAGMLAGIHQALKPGGTFLMQDIRAHSRDRDNLDHPLCPFLYTISTMHCMTVSLAQGGAGLGTVWGEELAVQMLGDAGFSNVEVKRVDGDVVNNYYVARKR